MLKSLRQLASVHFETPRVLKKVASAGRNLAELKGVAGTIPNQAILINTLGLQEAKESSEVENIVTTHDELFQAALSPGSSNNADAKEVLRYGNALEIGLASVNKTRLLTINQILDVQAALEENSAGLRKIPGTTLKDSAGRTIYTPPQDLREIASLMTDLENFINDDAIFEADPLIKMAIIHHQFESIHPFYDGNGRTGRIINILYLVKTGLLEIPVLYLSRYILRTKKEYYDLLQSVRTHDSWEEWTLYMLQGVEETAAEAIATIQRIQECLLQTKHRIRLNYKFYSQDLINNLFTRPYTKIELLEKDLKISRRTAMKYLDELTHGGFLQKKKVGRSNYFINQQLVSILTERKQARLRFS